MEDRRMHLDADQLLLELGWLRSLARSLVGSAGVDEDLVQETWLAASRTEGGVSRAWLAGTLRKLAARWHRTETRLRRREGAVARPEGVDAESMVERSELFVLVLEELRALDEPFRSTLLALYQEGLTVQAAAARLGIPEDTLRWRRREGVARLRQRLDGSAGPDWRAALLPLVSLPSTDLVSGGAASVAALSPLAYAGGLIVSWKVMSAALVVGLAVLVGVYGGASPAPAPVDLGPEGASESVSMAAVPVLPEAGAESSTRQDVATPQLDGHMSSPPPGPGEDRLEVTIVGPGNLPLAGAQVWLGDSPKPIDGMWVSNEEGIAVLPMPAESSAQVSSATDTLYGNALFFPVRSGGEVWVKLFPDADVTVQIVDRTGHPVEGVPVTRGGRFRSDLWSLTDAAGLAVLPHVLDAFKFNEDSHEFTVGPAILSGESLAVTLSREDVPREPIRIVLPPTGSLDVRVLGADGKLNPSAEKLRLIVDPEPGRTRDVPELADISKSHPLGMMELDLTDGTATIPFVGLGLDLLAEAKNAEATHSTFGFTRGPEAGGEHVVLSLRPLDAASELVGILRADDGALLRDRTVSGRLLLNEGGAFEDTDFVVETDSAGRFRIPIEKALVQSWTRMTRRIWKLEVDVAGPFDLYALETTLPERLSPGATDMGEVVLEHVTPWLAGRAVDATGAAVDVSSLEVSIRTPAGPSAYRYCGGRRGVAKGNTFAFLGTPPELDLDAGETLELRIEAEGLPRERLEVLDPHTEILVVFREAAALVGRVSTAPGDDPTAYYATFRSAGEAESRNRYGLGQLATNGRFELRGLPRIPGTVEIHTLQLDTIVAAVPGVVPGAGSAEQAERLDSIQLHSALNEFGLQVVDAEGNDLEGAYFDAPLLEGKQQSYGYGWFSWRVTEPELEGEVGAPGFAPVHVTLRPGSETVTLSPGLEVIVRPDGPIDLPGGAELAVRLVAVDWEEAVELEVLPGIGFVGHVSRPGVYLVRARVDLDGVAVEEQAFSAAPLDRITVSQAEREFTLPFAR
jgi:RNA polymerase sigma-70 factor (ECF subfamily)